MNWNELERKLYSLICKNDGIKAKEIAKAVGAGRMDINRLLYSSPFIRELCYQDEQYCWHGLIRQTRPHTGLGDFCGFYGTVMEFLKRSDEEWLEELCSGCRNIGRNLNDTRGLFHSFQDTREVMCSLFCDLEKLCSGSQYDWENWEICFELRIKRARYVRIYADVLVITEDKVFSLEFKMKGAIEPEEEMQAVKYAPYLEILFGEDYEVIPALILTKAADLYRWEQLPGSTAEIPVSSGDMLFNLFDEFMGFLNL